MNIVCRLGGFHTMMSFMGSIGSMMKGSEHYKKVQMQLSTCFQKRLFQGHCVDIVNKLMAAVLSSESDKNGNEMYIDKIT